jgi:hypothetical protein
MILPDKVYLHTLAADFVQLTLKTGFSQINDCILSAFLM